jgi:hypothetical protein
MGRLAHGHRHRHGLCGLGARHAGCSGRHKAAVTAMPPGDECLCVGLTCGWLADFPDDRPWFRRAGLGLRPDQNRGDHVFRTGLAIGAIEPEAELFALAEQVDLAEKAFHDALARRNEAQIAYWRKPSCALNYETETSVDLRLHLKWVIAA